MKTQQIWSILLSFGLPILILIIPTSFLPINDLNIQEQRVAALFVMAALAWILEPIPVHATSLLVIILEITCLSDQSLWLFKANNNHIQFGETLQSREIISTFASPIIMLFLGGFFLAIAASKYSLDINMARLLLKPFGTKPHAVMLGFMLTTAVFSMFMSNTATTAMMLSILAPVIRMFNSTDKSRIAFALCIPIAANIGGIGTPIGTPPNAIALQYLTGDMQISFGAWMSFAVPYVMILLTGAWLLLCWLYPSERDEMNISIQGTFLTTPKAFIVYITFVITIILWVMGSWHGMDAYAVALIPVAVFSAASIVTKDDLKRISWEVLWLVSGGFALGLALERTGLARHIVESIPFNTLPSYLIIVLASLLSVVLASFMSNTATANLLMPLAAVIASTTPSLLSLGGTKTLLLSVTFAASLGMSLPISTPPNALAYAAGYFDTRQLASIGVILGAFGLLMTYAMLGLMLAFS